MADADMQIEEASYQHVASISAVTQGDAAAMTQNAAAVTQDAAGPVTEAPDAAERVLLQAKLDAERAAREAAEAKVQAMQLQLEVAALRAQLPPRDAPATAGPSAPASYAAAVTAAGQVIDGRGMRRSDKRYPMPEKFVPPLDHGPESIQYIEKYLHDLRSYVRYGVDESVPPYLTFSQTSTGTFALVQQMADIEATLPTGSHLTIDEVCDKIAHRYLPSIDRATDARMRLLTGALTMKPGELLSEYKGRFLAELALSTRHGRPPMSEEDKLLLYRHGMTPELREACIHDPNANRLDTFDKVHSFAEAAETRLRDARNANGAVTARTAARALYMQGTQGSLPAGRGGRGGRGGAGGRGHGGRHAGRGAPGRDGGRGGRGGGRGGVKRQREHVAAPDGFFDVRRHADARDSGKTNKLGMRLTRGQLFQLMDQQRCYYCGNRVGNPPAHVGDQCPERNVR